MTASGSRIAEIAERHRPDPNVVEFDWCDKCDQVMPCDASILAAMLTPERLAAAALLVKRDIGNWDPDGRWDLDNDEHAAAILAALEAQP